MIFGGAFFLSGMFVQWLVIHFTGSSSKDASEYGLMNFVCCFVACAVSIGTYMAFTNFRKWIRSNIVKANKLKERLDDGGDITKDLEIRW